MNFAFALSNWLGGTVLPFFVFQVPAVRIGVSSILFCGGFWNCYASGVDFGVFHLGFARRVDFPRGYVSYGPARVSLVRFK